MIKQITAATLMSLITVPRRLGASLVIVIGIAGVVCVFLSLFAMAIGFTNTIASSGRSDRVIFIASGANSEGTSYILRSDAATILGLHSIRRDVSGAPVASNEVLRLVALRKTVTHTLINVSLRGVSGSVSAVYPELKILTGRMFRPAIRELIVGKSAQNQFEGLAVGDHLSFAGGEWTIVGTFESGGDTHESELLGDSDTILSAFHSNGFQDVAAILNNPNAFRDLGTELAERPGLPVSAMRERDYFATQSRVLASTLYAVGYVVGIIMSLGAVFGALNTMHNAISVRATEIATLRAIGFSGFAVAASVLAEAMILALFGAIVGFGCSWLFFDSQTVSMLSGTGTQIVFPFIFNFPLVTAAVGLALVIGFVGGLAPAFRAASLPVSTVLHTG